MNNSKDLEVKYQELSDSELETVVGGTGKSNHKAPAKSKSKKY